MEESCSSVPDLNSILEMERKFGSNADREDDCVKKKSVTDEYFLRELNQRKLMHESVMRLLVRYQGLLHQFSRSTVRSEFYKGNLTTPCCSSILRSITQFSEILLPSPDNNSVDFRMQFIGKLLSRDESEPIDLQGNFFAHRQCFSWWKDSFSRLIESPKWKDLHEKNETALGATGAHFSERGGKYLRSSSKRIDSSLSSSSDDDHGFKSEATNKKQGDYEHMFLEALKGLSVRKEIIAPAKFKASGSITMDKFLKSYERYFSNKFDGSQEEMASHLEKFLSGSSLSAYIAMDGANMEYFRLKPKLLQWFNSQKINALDTAREQFVNLRREPNETSMILCLRLERFAMKAFKHSSELERQLVTKLMKIAPRSLVQQIENAEGVLSVTGSGGITWEMIKKLAEKDDQRRMVSVNGVADSQENGWPDNFEYERPSDDHIIERKRSPRMFRKTGNKVRSGGQIYFSNHEGAKPRFTEGAHSNRPSENPPYSSDASADKGRYSSPTFNGKSQRHWSGMKRKQQESSGAIDICAWCGKRGHRATNCWVRQKRCFACGSRDHWQSDCPEKQQNQPLPCCPNCQGPHLGMSCGNNKDPANLNSKALS